MLVLTIAFVLEISFVEHEVQPCLSDVGSRLNLLDSLFCISES